MGIKQLLGLTTIAATVAATAVSAQSIGNITGYVGLNLLGGEIVAEGDVTDRNAYYGYSFEGAGAMGLGSNFTLALDATYQTYDFQGSGNLAFRGPSSSYNVGAHALYQLGTNTKLGAFVGYGAGENLDGSDPFDVLYYGVEGHMTFGSSTFAYAQLGAGNIVTDNGSSNGFANGYMVRAGAGYTYSAQTTFLLDVEYANVPDGIEDNGETGILYGVRLGAESKISSMPLTLTYSVGFDHWEAEFDQVNEEVVLAVGLRYNFGGAGVRDNFDAGIVGSPRLAAASGAWIENFN